MQEKQYLGPHKRAIYAPRHTTTPVPSCTQRPEPVSSLCLPLFSIHVLYICFTMIQSVSILACCINHILLC
jgi:hypothetical protein